MLETFLRSFGQYWHDSITVTVDLLTRRHVWWCKWPITPHPKGAVLNELLAVEAIWVQWIHCQIEEIVHYLTRSSNQKTGALWKGNHQKITPLPATWSADTMSHISIMFLCQILTLHLNIAAEIETHQVKQRFSSFGESVWILATVFFS